LFPDSAVDICEKFMIIATSVIGTVVLSLHHDYGSVQTYEMGNKTGVVEGVLHCCIGIDV
jgi:hypothetical protein